jgi:hypothetical protein
MTSVYAIERETYPFTVRTQGNRLHIRTFKTADDMHKFLNTGSNSALGNWHQSTKGLKAGTYAYAGGQWHNVKRLDASTLAHI